MKHCAESAFMKKCIVNLCWLCCFWSVSAQRLPIGQWDVHPEFSNVRLVTGSAHSIFAASTNGLFAYNRTQGSTRIISTLQGLDDTNISALEYQPQLEALFIGHPSGQIELLNRNQIRQNNTLRDANLSGSKQINGFYFTRESGYAITEAGVATINLTNLQLQDFYREIGPEGQPIRATDLVVFQDSLFVSCQFGILVGAENQNLLDFNNWQNATDQLANARFSQSDDHLFAIEEAVLFEYNQGVWQAVDTFPEPILEVKGAYYLSDEHLYYFDEDRVLKEKDIPLDTPVNDFLVLENDVFYAKEGNGLLVVTPQETRSIQLAGPVSPLIQRMRIVDDELYIFYHASGVPPGGQPVGYSTFIEGLWEYQEIDDFPQTTDVTRFQGTTYLSSSTAGLYRLETQDLVPELENVNLSALASFDQLWATEYDGDDGLHILDQQGWQSFPPGLTGSVFPEMIDVALDNVLWITRGRGDGYGSVAYEPFSDSFREISRSDGIPDEQILDLAISLNDEVWIATESGLRFFPNASSIFNEEDALTAFFDNGPLFESEPVNALVFDGGNRLWVGSDRGLWLFNESLTRIEHHFTTNNSPLPSNKIIQLAFNYLTGELFVLTDRGLMSYQSNAAIPIPVHTEVKIFPNPVNPDFSGEVGLTGLANNAVIKITDVKGRLVNQIMSNGSAASWDLSKIGGGKVAPGIYLFFSSTEDGADTFVGKIAVMP
jgi:hypothetical protein